MIISGYQGIGKSTLAKRSKEYIDLESGNFFVNGKKVDDWHIPYCNIAIHLSEQGYHVFVSSHKVVRDYLASLPLKWDLLIVHPALSLKDEWLSKLRSRYESTGLDKDFRALKNAEQCYEQNIQDLIEQSGFSKLEIKQTDYDLEMLLRQHSKAIDIAQYVDRCICCGEIVPEGRCICPACEQKDWRHNNGEGYERYSK